MTLGGELTWIHRFVVQPGLDVITSVSTAIGLPGGPPSHLELIGNPLNVYVWDDADGSGTPSNDDNLLAQATGVITNVDDNVFMTIPVVANLGPVGSTFFIGASTIHTDMQAPGPMDFSQPSNGRAFFAGSTSGPWDPNNPEDGHGVFDLDLQSPSAVWLLRANAADPIPAVSTWGLVALALLMLTAGSLVFRRRMPSMNAA